MKRIRPFVGVFAVVIWMLGCHGKVSASDIQQEAASIASVQKSELSPNVSLTEAPPLSATITFTGTASEKLYDTISQLVHTMQTESETAVPLYIDLSAVEQLKDVSWSAFDGCTMLVGIALPRDTTKIWYSAFKDCVSLADIQIPNGVTTVCGNAFRSCTALTRIRIPDSVTEVEEGAFEYCTALADVTLPTAMSKVRGYTFNGCTALAGLTLPQGITRIEMYAFHNCASLASITIPLSVTEIWRFAFKGCSALTTINYAGTKAQWSNISIDADGNDILQSVTINYNYTRD